MEFLPEVKVDKIIKVIGVGGGGNNAVNYMYKEGVEGVDFYVCNTDIQALRHSPVPNKLQLGAILTSGLGAGSSAKCGEEAALESESAIEEMLSDGTRMVFITAGFGGGTGTGAAPVIASIAKRMKILTVGILTLPFSDEGDTRQQQALEGIERIKPHLDALITVSNDNIVDMYGDLTFLEAFAQADNILCTAARGIADIIYKTGQLNVDFKDIETAMTQSGRALLGMGKASGENRAKDALINAIKSPLLDNTKILGAQHILINLTYGAKAPTLSETKTIKTFLQEEAGNSANLKMGITYDETLKDELAVTVIATGFEAHESRKNDRFVTGQIEAIIPEKSVPTFTESDDIIIEDMPNNTPVNHSLGVNPPQEDITKIFHNFSESDIYEEPIAQPLVPEHQPISTHTYTKTYPSQGNVYGQPMKKQHHAVDNDMNIPAYMRRNIELEKAPPSNSSHVERLSISQRNDDPSHEPTFQFTPNKMLHDNVD
jgi:cell division protein FtsZ